MEEERKEGKKEGAARRREGAQQAGCKESGVEMIDGGKGKEGQRERRDGWRRGEKEKSLEMIKIN